jgi:isoleucyl-tRNA synthetase
VAKKAMGTVALLCNVKGVGVQTAAAKFPASFTLRPNSSRIGALFREKTREVLAALKPVEGQKAVWAYVKGLPVRAETASGGVDVPLSAFELTVTPREGYEVAEKSNVFVAILRDRDRKLVAEGLVRDLARRLQALRKERGFVPTAMLKMARVAGLEDEDLEQLQGREEKVAFLVRVREVQVSKEKGPRGHWAESDLDGKPIFIDVG